MMFSSKAKTALAVVGSMAVPAIAYDSQIGMERPLFDYNNTDKFQQSQALNYTNPFEQKNISLVNLYDAIDKARKNWTAKILSAEADRLLDLVSIAWHIASRKTYGNPKGQAYVDRLDTLKRAAEIELLTGKVIFSWETQSVPVRKLLYRTKLNLLKAKFHEAEAREIINNEENTVFQKSLKDYLTADLKTVKNFLEDAETRNNMALLAVKSLFSKRSQFKLSEDTTKEKFCMEVRIAVLADSILLDPKKKLWNLANFGICPGCAKAEVPLVKYENPDEGDEKAKLEELCCYCKHKQQIRQLHANFYGV